MLEDRLESRAAKTGRDANQIRQAIETLKSLRKGVAKPEGLSVREMIEQGRA
jgi:predicted DNA-binding protein